MNENANLRMLKLEWDCSCIMRFRKKFVGMHLEKWYSSGSQPIGSRHIFVSRDVKFGHFPIDTSIFYSQKYVFLPLKVWEPLCYSEKWRRLWQVTAVVSRHYPCHQKIWEIVHSWSEINFLTAVSFVATCDKWRQVSTIIHNCKIFV